jgi:hypothetical protein
LGGKIKVFVNMEAWPGKSRKLGPRLRSATWKLEDISWKLVHRFRELVLSGADLFRAKPINQRSSSVVEMPVDYIFLNHSASKNQAQESFLSAQIP